VHDVTEREGQFHFGPLARPDVETHRGHISKLMQIKNLEAGESASRGSLCAFPEVEVQDIVTPILEAGEGRGSCSRNRGDKHFLLLRRKLRESV
jgi:hypothetical protein